MSRPPLSVIVNRKISWDFLILMALTIVANMFYFSDLYVLRKDGMYVFEVFYFFYNNLFFNHEFALWEPYYSFGLPANFHQIVSFTPLSYLAFFIGLFFKVKNVLWLFKISILMEQLILLLGTYLLSRQLFTDRKTVLMVCLGMLGSHYYFDLLYYNLRIFYMLPLVIYFLF